MRTLLNTSLASAVTAVVGSVATEPDGAWFRRLDKPDFYPPAQAFPIVWTALYADVAITSAVAIDGALDRKERAALKRALAVNLALNGAWSWVFWKARRPDLAAVEAVLLTLSSADLVRRVGRVRRGAGLALTPYPLWCAFAAILSTAIADRNPGR